LTSASTNRNLVLSTNAQTIINADTDLTAKVTAAITAGWSIIYITERKTHPSFLRGWVVHQTR